MHAYHHYAVKATLTTCPSCLKRAEIVDRFTLPSTDGPVGLLGRIGTRFRFARTSERLRSGARDTCSGRRLSHKPRVRPGRRRRFRHGSELHRM
jgi:hypothetical protein